MAPSLLSEISVVPDHLNKIAPPKETREHIFRSKLPDIELSNHMPLAQYCLEKVSQWPDRPCLIDGLTGKEYTYGEVDAISRRVAAGLVKLGIKQGGVVALILPNTAEFVFVFLGAAIGGAVVTTANPFYTAPDLVKQINQARATVVVTQSAYVEKLKGLDVTVRLPSTSTAFRGFRTVATLFWRGSEIFLAEWRLAIPWTTQRAVLIEKHCLHHM